MNKYKKANLLLRDCITFTKEYKWHHQNIVFTSPPACNADSLLIASYLIVRGHSWHRQSYYILHCTGILNLSFGLRMKEWVNRKMLDTKSHTQDNRSKRLIGF